MKFTFVVLALFVALAAAQTPEKFSGEFDVKTLPVNTTTNTATGSATFTVTPYYVNTTINYNATYEVKLNGIALNSTVSLSLQGPAKSGEAVPEKSLNEQLFTFDNTQGADVNKTALDVTGQFHFGPAGTTFFNSSLDGFKNGTYEFALIAEFTTSDSENTTVSFTRAQIAYVTEESSSASKVAFSALMAIAFVVAALF